MRRVLAHTLASSARSRPISVNFHRSMPHPATQINLGFVGRNKKGKLNYANDSDIRHCSVLSLRSWSLLIFRKQMSATKVGKIHGSGNWWQGYLTVMPLSFNGKAVNAEFRKGSEPKVIWIFIQAHDWSKVSFRCVLPAHSVSLNLVSEEIFVVFL